MNGTRQQCGVEGGGGCGRNGRNVNTLKRKCCSPRWPIQTDILVPPSELMDVSGAADIQRRSTRRQSTYREATPPLTLTAMRCHNPSARRKLNVSRRGAPRCVYSSRISSLRPLLCNSKNLQKKKKPKNTQIIPKFLKIKSPIKTIYWRNVVRHREQQISRADATGCIQRQVPQSASPSRASCWQIRFGTVHQRRPFH